VNTAVSWVPFAASVWGVVSSGWNSVKFGSEAKDFYSKPAPTAAAAKSDAAPTTANSLDGIWEEISGLSRVMSISGSTGTMTVPWVVGTYWRNLTSTGNLTWSGQWLANSNSWVSDKWTLSADGKTLLVGDPRNPGSTFKLIKKGDAASATPTQKTTFNGHQYQLFEDSKTWTEAKKHCESLGGYLVTIKSHEEQAFIATLISRGKKNFYWIGGYCDADRKFRWVTGEPMTYTNWMAGEPNNHQGRQDKMAIYRLGNPIVSRSKPYNWDDVANDGIISGDAFFSAGNFGYICEWNQ